MTTWRSEANKPNAHNISDWRFCPVCSYPLLLSDKHGTQAFNVGCGRGHKFTLVQDGGCVRLSSRKEKHADVR